MESILHRAQTLGTPLIEGNMATFVWHGARPPVLIGDFTDWEDGPTQTFTRVSRGVWTCSLTFPADAYLEYAFCQNGERLLDPSNSRTTPNGLGKINQYFYMPDGSPTPLIRRDASIPHGAVTRHVLRPEGTDLFIGRQRVMYLYQPPVVEPVPLVVVWDGVDYLRRARLPIIVDNLIAQERIRPVALAMIQNGKRARTVEYACSDATLGFLTHHILPLARANLNLRDPAGGNFGVLGASMGGLMALYTAIRLPHIFNRVISQSGAFDGEEYSPVIHDLIRYGPVQPISIWMDVGTYDFPPILAANQALITLLQERGYTASLQQHNAGHNFPTWRDQVGQGFAWLYGKPEDRLTGSK